MTEAARAHHLIERTPDGPISGVNGRPRACTVVLLRALLATVLDAFFFVIPVNCYDFLWPPCVLSRKRSYCCFIDSAIVRSRRDQIYCNVRPVV